MTPRHYDLDPEPWVVIEGWALNFARGSAIKYIARAGRKGDELDDLRKAAHCLQREIERLERERNGSGR